jgi:hypothetical protein
VPRLPAVEQSAAAEPNNHVAVGKKSRNLAMRLPSVGGSPKASAAPQPLCYKH